MTGKYLLITFFLWSCLLPASSFSNELEEKMAVEYLERAKHLYVRSLYDSLPYYYHTSNLVFEQLGIYERSAECKLGMVDYFRMMNRFSEASVQLERAELYIVEHIGKNTESWADAQFVRGKLFLNLGMEEKALEVLSGCFYLEGELGLRPERTARIYNALGVVYFTYGDLDSAELNYQKAYDTYREITNEPTIEKGLILYNMGLIYSLTERQEKWMEYTQMSIENNILLFGPDFPELGLMYASLASYYIASGRLDSANLYLDKAESIMINAYGNDYFDLSRIYVNRARINKYSGNYKASLENYLQALSINENQDVPNQSLENITYLNISHLYKELGEYQTAFNYLIRILETKSEVHPTRMALYFSYLADILIYLGKYEEAEEYLQEAIQIKTEYYERDFHRLAYDYQRYGVLLDSIQKFPEASEKYQLALSYIRKLHGENNIRTAKMYLSLGDHSLLVKNYEAALGNYQRSLHSLAPEYDLLALDQNPEPKKISDLMFYLRLLKKKAITLENLANMPVTFQDTNEYLKAAFMTYDFSIQVTEILRNSYLNDESKLYLSENERKTYEEGVRMAFACNEVYSDPAYLKHAFRIAEKAKYATLQSVLAREDALELSGIPDSLQNLESDLQKQLHVYQRLINESLEDTLPDQVKLQQYRVEQFRIQEQVAKLHRSLESEYPDYYELVYNNEVSDPEELAKSLRRNEKIIEYFICGRELYTFEISRKDFTCHLEPFDSLFNYDLDLVEQYILGVDLQDSDGPDHLSFIESSTRLYKKLIPSADGCKNLIIIPEGKLAYFPFDVLITKQVPAFSGLFRDVPFLIQSHSIRYGYASTLLQSDSQLFPGNLNKYLGFAPGYLSMIGEENQSDIRREIRIDRKLLDALPGSIEEVNEIGKMLKGSTFTGQDASEGRFKALAGENHIIHLATHAYIDDEDPLKSMLVFSENPELGEDGLLHVHELYNMNLNARMVVLSACNTGSGELQGGEGIMSLARAFFYAGVPNIVMTLWTVSDRQSYKLMRSFYEYLRKGRKAEISLRKAKLDYLENALPGYQGPRYWAGYILIGNPDHLFFPYWYRQLIVAVIFILIFLAGIRVYGRIQKRRQEPRVS